MTEEGLHVDLGVLPDDLDDAVIVHRVVACLRGLEREHLHVPLLEQLRYQQQRVAHQDVEPRVERDLLQLEVNVVERLQQEPPHIGAGSAAVVGVEPRVDDEDGLEAHPARYGLGEGRVVVEAKGVESEPVHRGRRLLSVPGIGVLTR